MIYLSVYFLIFLYVSVRHVPRFHTYINTLIEDLSVKENAELYKKVKIFIAFFYLLYVLFLLVFCVFLMLLDVFDYFKNFKNE